MKKINEEINSHLNNTTSLFKDKLFNEGLTYIQSPNHIFIPKKLKHVVDNYISIEDLQSVYKNTEVVKELIYLFTSYLYDPYKNTGLDFENNMMYISAKKITKLFFNNNYTLFKKLIDILEKGTEKGAILEVDKRCKVGLYTRTYRLSDIYFAKGIEKYEIKTNKVKEIVKKTFYEKLSKSFDNPIAKHIIKTYSRITIPTLNKVKIKLNKLIKSGFTSKSGKLYVKYDGISEKDYSKYIYHDDVLDRFEVILGNGFIIPIIGDEKSGGRVVDSITLINKWIRELCLFDGKPLCELDFKCLHPNIIMKLFGGNTKYITHEQVANDLNITKEEVKRHHLTFFNLNSWCFNNKNNILHQYYSSIEPELVDNILKLKEKHNVRIGNTYVNVKVSRMLFEEEVKLMTKIIEKLTKEDISTLYCYDAIYASPKDKNRVRQVMLDISKKNKIYSLV